LASTAISGIISPTNLAAISLSSQTIGLLPGSQLAGGSTSYIQAAQLITLSTGTIGFLPGAQLGGGATSYIQNGQLISIATGTMNATFTSSLTVTTSIKVGSMTVTGGGGTAGSSYLLQITTVTTGTVPTLVISSMGLTNFQSIQASTSAFVVDSSSGSPAFWVDTSSVGVTDSAFQVIASTWGAYSMIVSTSTSQPFQLVVSTTGPTGFWSAPKATLATTPVPYAGFVAYCTDCTTDNLCVSTSTINSFTRMGARTTACQ
jgi:hypothetical protein